MPHTSRFRRVLTLLMIHLFLGLPVARGESGPSSAAPEISHVVDGVDQGGTLVIFGENLNPGSAVWVWQEKGASGDPYAAGERVEELKATARALPRVDKLPRRPLSGSLKADHLGATGSSQVLMARMVEAMPRMKESPVPAIIWVENEAGLSAPYLVNAPQLWFASAEQAAPGERLRLFGINLFGFEFTSGAPLVALKRRGTDNVYWAEPLVPWAQENPNYRQHELNVRLPRDLPAGNYQLWLHNLGGGPYAWSNPVDLEVVVHRSLVQQLGMIEEASNLVPAPGYSEKVAVVQPGGLVADGLTDNLSAIQRAVDGLHETGGGVVLLPHGTYAISDTLHLRRGVVLKGAGQQATTLTSSPLVAFATGEVRAEKPLIRMYSETGLQEISVVAGPGVDLNVHIRDEPVARDVFIKRATIENTTAYLKEADRWEPSSRGILVSWSTRNFVLYRSRVIATDTLSFFGYGNRHRYAKIVGNEFEAFPRQQGSHANVSLMAMSESIFQDNVLLYGNRAFSTGGGLWRNYIAGNHVVSVKGGPNGSDLFQSEYGGAEYAGPAVGAADGLTLPETVPTALLKQLEEIRSYNEQYLFVTGGRGFGQYRQVIGQNGRHLTLDRPWLVEPDATSTVAILRLSARNLFLNNSTEGGRGYFQFFWGSAVENVVAGHEADGVHSIWSAALAEGEVAAAVLAYNHFYNNRLTNGGSIRLFGVDGTPEKAGTALVLGNRLVRNQVWRPGGYGGASQYYAYWNWLGGPSVEPGRSTGITLSNGLFNVIENNYIDGAEVGIRVDNGRGSDRSTRTSQGNVIRWNRIDGAADAVVTEGTANQVIPPDYQSY